MLSSCSENYPPIESSEEENRVVMTLRFEEEKYDVKYELYRALFLTLKPSVDGGDDSVWSGSDKQKYIDEINQKIIARVSDIFSVFSIAKEIGIDVYSKSYDKQVKTLVKASVEGGIVGDLSYEGFGGDYEKYLNSLKEIYLNYSVQDLMMRYALATEEIYYYYRGDINNDANLGNLSYTKDDVKAFYDSEDSVRIRRLFLSSDSPSFTTERVQEIREKIAAATTEEEVIYLMINYSLTADTGSEMKNGTIVGKHNLDSFYYQDFTDAAFTIPYFGTSEPIKVSTTINDGYFILYKTRKESTHFEECYEEIRNVYVENRIGEILDARRDALASGATDSLASSFFESLDYSKITMD